jgi:hypothetical protein
MLLWVLMLMLSDSGREEKNVLNRWGDKNND